MRITTLSMSIVSIARVIMSIGNSTGRILMQAETILVLSAGTPQADSYQRAVLA